MKDNLKNVQKKLNEFPPYHMSQSTQALLHQQVMDTIEDSEIRQKRKGVFLIKAKVGMVTAAAVVIVSILSVNLLNDNPNSSGGENPIPINQDVDQEFEQMPGEEEDNNLYDPLLLEQQATEILQAIYDHDMDVLSSHVHTEKGLLFSPYFSVMDDTVRFEKNEVPSLLESEATYLWGYGEANMEIQLTPADYFDKYLQVKRFFKSDEVFVDTQNQEVDPTNYLKTVFPDSKIVEFYHAGTEQYSGMDWRSLNLVFEQDEEGAWRLVAIINNLFTP